MNNSHYPTARKSGLVLQEMPDELLIYDLETNKAHCLNKTASMVWKACDGTNSVTDIARLVGKDAGAPVSEDLVWLAIDQLSENALLEQELKADFAGRSRREAIKKIGLASMVALPVIASLVAPNTVMASVSCACSSGNTTRCGVSGCPANCNGGLGVCQ